MSTAEHESLTQRWLGDLARVAGAPPTEAQRYARQLAAIEMQLEAKARRRGRLFLVGAALAVGAALLLWLRAGGPSGAVGAATVDSHEAPAATRMEPTRGEAQTRPVSAVHEGATSPLATPPTVEGLAGEVAPASEAPGSGEGSGDATVDRPKPELREGSTAPRPPSAEALLAAANLARREHRVDRARALLREVLSHHPQSASAEQASFLLARVESELAHDEGAALEAYARYLEAYPRGRFAAGARGRILTAHAEDSPASASAQTAARDYLDHHPDGPYAELARRTLADGE